MASVEYEHDEGCGDVEEFSWLWPNNESEDSVWESCARLKAELLNVYQQNKVERAHKEKIKKECDAKILKVHCDSKLKYGDMCDEYEMKMWDQEKKHQRELLEMERRHRSEVRKLEIELRKLKATKEVPTEEYYRLRSENEKLVQYNQYLRKHVPADVKIQKK